MRLPERRFLHPAAPLLAGALAVTGGDGLARAAQVNPYPAPARASTMAVAPLYVGPAWGDANPQARTATLHVRIDNTGTVPDRLVRINCAPIGQAALLDGIVRQVDGVQQNGLDIPGRTPGSDADLASAAQADISLTGLQSHLAPGMTVSCTLGFLNAGERLVVFSLGAPGNPVNEP
ncbi:copper(I)-binding protein [Endobacter medicaginis]|uniref:Copper chaperone PCu(A)C n=1 Tax=Endobacter medicaginis TaxID=1181271 RepID=A0A850NPC4_9PROT|nr:copper chaperone PCu(A)C [Endobacter medicaginis]MBB3174332.1 copper(I)-binding protein [Endobacter medicaginis]MCX5476639.1 copper chaperone PCu(A)C [Endobacter medicaginis]NVN29706.1 copper chaperone PCu(A)C [Endobacter medicaginis]